MSSLLQDSEVGEKDEADDLRVLKQKLSPIDPHIQVVKLPQLIRYSVSIGHVSLTLENEVGELGGRKSIFSMLTYRTLFFGCNNRTVTK